MTPYPNDIVEDKPESEREIIRNSFYFRYILLNRLRFVDLIRGTFSEFSFKLFHNVRFSKLNNNHDVCFLFVYNSQKMHLFKFLVLVFGFCLVFTKAESEMKDEEAFVLDELDNNASEDWSPNLKEHPKADTEDSKMMPEEDSKEEDSQKRHHSSYPIYMTMRVPTNHYFRFFHASYCFRRRCYGTKYALLTNCEVKLTGC